MKRVKVKIETSVETMLGDKPIRDVKGKLGFWEYNLED